MTQSEANFTCPERLFIPIHPERIAASTGGNVAYPGFWWFGVLLNAVSELVRTATGKVAAALA